MMAAKGYDLFEVVLKRTSDGYQTAIYLGCKDMYEASLQATSVLTDAHYEAQSVKKVGRVYVPEEN